MLISFTQYYQHLLTFLAIIRRHTFLRRQTVTTYHITFSVTVFCYCIFQYYAFLTKNVHKHFATIFSLKCIFGIFFISKLFFPLAWFLIKIPKLHAYAFVSSINKSLWSVHITRSLRTVQNLPSIRFWSNQFR